MRKKTNSRPRPKRKTTTRNEDWDRVFGVLRAQAQARTAPSLNQLTDSGSTPWQLLVGTILSLRTRDEVTLTASRRLFSQAPSPSETRSLSEDALADLLFPVGFYRTKARQILAIARLLEPRGDEVPSTKDGLLGLPGVGPKTANLVLNLAFGIEEICVDTHVHRIPNRLGWIDTRTPEASEAALRDLWPREHWIEANALLVSFGQSTCTPQAPRCSTCPFHGHCDQKGVGRHR